MNEEASRVTGGGRAYSPGARRRRYVLDAQSRLQTIIGVNYDVLIGRAGKIKNPELRAYCEELESQLTELAALLTAAQAAGEQAWQEGDYT